MCGIVGIVSRPPTRATPTGEELLGLLDLGTLEALRTANELLCGLPGVLALAERFELVAPFDPVPLYEVLGPRGFHHRTEKRGPGEYVVEFVQTGITAESTVREVLDRHPATAELLAEAGFDACCGGLHALEHAARAHGKNLGELLRRLQAAVVASA